MFKYPRDFLVHAYLVMVRTGCKTLGITLISSLYIIYLLKKFNLKICSHSPKILTRVFLDREDSIKSRVGVSNFLSCW